MFSKWPFGGENSINTLYGFLRQMKKKSSNHDTFMKSILHYFSHLCVYLFHLFIHIKTYQI